MKQTLKTLYNIDTKALIKYTDKVYKIKSDDESDYCLKYVDCLSNNSLIEKVNTLKLSDSFVMPIKTCIRTPQGQKNNKLFYLTPWVEDDLIESKDLKVKYYLLQIGQMHAKTSYTLNVSASFFNEIAMKLEENIEECYQKYESMVYIIERKEYKSPFEWYFLNHFKDVIESLDKSRLHLNKFKELVKNKSTIRQVIIHQNFSYDHVFLSKDKIIGNDKMKLNSPVFDIKSLFDVIEFGTIDISGMFDEYSKNMHLEEYELEWMMTLLFIVKDLKVSHNDFDNLSKLMHILFRYKSVCELENKLDKKNSTE